MGSIVSGVTDAFGITDTDAPRKAAETAAATQAGYQREALDYLKETEALPQQFREGALARLGGLYGLEGGTGSQQQLIDQAMSSPLYQAILGGQEAGEQSILRSAAATGGLRSGNVQESLADFSTQLQNKALLESYNQQLTGLQGLATIPSSAPQIVAGTAGIGQTLAQGKIAGVQAQTAAQNQVFSDAVGLAQLGYAAFSDIRLKESIEHIGEKNGHQWFKWQWNEKAADLGLTGESEGVMAHLLYEYMPEAIGYRDGYITINYDMLEVH